MGQTGSVVEYIAETAMENSVPYFLLERSEL
jgi:hypothetical protein